MILGGIGFLPINDIVKNKTKKFNKLKLQSKIVSMKQMCSPMAEPVVLLVVCIKVVARS